jgi:prepilin-type N-terminal cleavage/methylation domain-containing protein
MKKSFLNQVVAARRWQTGAVRAFTLTELLVVLAVVAVLAAVLLSASFTTQERVWRAECVSNLRQIVTGWNMYQQDFNQMMPCHWPGYASSGSTSNPWRTYEAGRFVPGTPGWDPSSGNPQGPWNLGMLFATGLVPNPRVFYCPGTARISSPFSYDYYAAVSNIWPSTSISSGDSEIRTGYNYLPQGKAQELIDASHRGPKIANGSCAPTTPGCTPLQQNDIDPNKSIFTDLVSSLNTATLSHRASGSVAGLNALFLDGRVVFQNARSNPQAFDPALWGSPSTDYIGNNAPNFRYVMSLWQP